MSKLRYSFATAALGFCCALGAQQKILEAIGVEKSIGYRFFNFLGDLNGDGYEDLGATSTLPTHSYAQIAFISGKDGTLLRKLITQREYVTPFSTGDWNGDGVPDYCAGRIDQLFRPSSEIRSGRDDRLLEVFKPWSRSGRFAVVIANVELDGDGKPDLVFQNVDGLRTQESGLYGFSNSKKLLWTLPMPWLRNPTHTGSVGDVDGDGCDDIGAWDDLYTKNTIWVVSGRTGRVLYSVTGERSTDLLGSGEITTCGDVDGDGRDDFVASSAGSGSDGLVMVFAGRTGKTLFAWRTPRTGFGDSIASGYDLDQDGVNDLIVGNHVCSACKPAGNGGQAHVFSLRTGKEIAIVRPTNVSQYTYFGWRVRMGRPRPGSTFPVFAVWDTYRFKSSRFDAPGRITLYHMLPSGVTPFGTACKGTLTAPPRIGINDKVGPGLRAHLSGAPPATTALFLLGVSDQRWGSVKLPLALDPLGFVGCKLYTSVELLCPLRTGTTGIDEGYAYLDLPAPPGLTLFGQWLVLGSGPLAPGAATGALRWKR